MAVHLLRPLRFLLWLLVGIVALLGLAWLTALIRERDTAVPAGIVYVATPLGRVAGQVSGPPTGVPVLIVGGTAGWSGFWRDVASHLAQRGYRVFAVDLPPFGYSDHDPAARYDRPHQAERLAAVLASFTHQPALVVAHSFGAGVATELALRYPAQVGRLVLVDASLGTLDPVDGGDATLLRSAVIAQPLTAATLTNPWALGPLARSVLYQKAAAAAWHETLRQPMRRPGSTAAYAAWLPALFATDDGGWSRHTARLAQLAMPVRLIWGEADTVAPIAQGEALARLTHGSLKRLSGVGHVPHIEDPAHFLPALDAALAGPR